MGEGLEGFDIPKGSVQDDRLEAASRAGGKAMKGWEEQIITPLNNLLKHQGKRLMWKEKWGRIRCEGLVSLTDNQIVGTLDPRMEQVIEEASKLCCAKCGRWHGWLVMQDPNPAYVEPRAIKGWIMTLCQYCREEVERDNG